MRIFFQKLKNCAVNLALVLALALPALVGVPFLAARAADSLDAITTLEFVNASNDSPDLYVTKSVQTVSGNASDYADEEFTFVVKFDGEFAKSETYRVYNSDGYEVFTYTRTVSGVTETLEVWQTYTTTTSTDPNTGETVTTQTAVLWRNVTDINGNTTSEQVTTATLVSEGYNKVAYKTDNYGTFTLKAGQTARFEWVGSGVTYEVTEQTKTGWTQIVPSGGSAAVGTITDNGSIARFVNVIGGESDETQLTVYKTISFPDDYEAPDTPDFLFQIKISGKAYANEAYTITDLSTGAESTGKTDANGYFTLKGNQTATFTVDADVDYKVEELGALADGVGGNGSYSASDVDADSGWRVTTDSSYAGSTGTAGTEYVVFNNATASFIVTKSLADGGTSDDTFTFVLYGATGAGADGETEVRAGATYWLYNTDGTPVTDANGDVVSGVTDVYGQFTLQAKQAAVFYGIAAGEVYSVQELAQSGWKQTIPASTDGYTDKTVLDSVEILPFVNEKLDLTGQLSVTKDLVSSSGAIPNLDEEFQFYLYKYDEANGIWDAVSAVYSITQGSSTATYKTGNDGGFKLVANQTAVFSTLSAGTYKVEEADVPEGYYVMEIVVSDKDGTRSLTGGTSASGELELDTELSFAFTNNYSTTGSLKVIKKDSSGEAVEGVSFALYDAAGTLVGEYTTDKDGQVLFEELVVGDYALVETAAPSGYTLLADAVEITIPYVISADDATAQGVDTTDAVEVVTNGETWYYFYNLTYTVTDTAVFGIPTAGGHASYTFLWIALAVLFCGLGVFAVSLRRRQGGRPGQGHGRRRTRPAAG